MASYIVWHVVQSMVPYMPTAYRQALQQLYQAIYGIEGESQRWEICTTNTDLVLGFSTGALYVDAYFTQQDKLKVTTPSK